MSRPQAKVKSIVVKLVVYWRSGSLMLLGRILESYARAGACGGGSGTAYAVEGQYGKEWTSGQGKPATRPR